MLCLQLCLFMTHNTNGTPSSLVDVKWAELGKTMCRWSPLNSSDSEAYKTYLFIGLQMQIGSVMLLSSPKSKREQKSMPPAMTSPIFAMFHRIGRWWCMAEIGEVIAGGMLACNRAFMKWSFFAIILCHVSPNCEETVSLFWAPTSGSPGYTALVSNLLIYFCHKCLLLRPQ